MNKVDLKQCKMVSFGLMKLWYEEKEDGVLWLVAFQVFNDRFRFYVPRGTVTTSVDGKTLRIKVED